ncbi:hypothetical protein OEZ85_005911 [Tetradesmus obliquus]|uniref:VPS37 C-terminal domain-containing protein n=1 Tax=Tetradesmus obliquus TaxID=3088 RepID=A0ABY8UI22_TETOB|nr:hypothetical protein OEZ85_005911 [Tetradesmus obliquus]
MFRLLEDLVEKEAEGRMSAADQQLSASQSLPGCFQRLQQVQQEYNGLHSEIAALRDEIAVQEKVEKAGGEGGEAARQRLIHLRQKELMLMASAKVMQERMLKLEEQITKLTPGAAAGQDYERSDQRQAELDQMAYYVKLYEDMRTPKQTWYSRLFSAHGQDQAKKAQ